MKMKMHDFAFGAKCGGFGASGFVSAWAPAACSGLRTPSSLSIEPSAIIPSPLAELVRKSRRLCCACCCACCSKGFARRFMSYSRVTNSSMFMMIRTVANQAAVSSAETPSGL